ncbi:MAG: amidohydrolase family protein [Clostridiales bacterium]|jgi:adenine deaminase|nr:amidohydrolase family protein [Clostridiales bacterium]
MATSLISLDDRFCEDYDAVQPELLAAVRGEIPCDFVVRNAAVLNAFTDEAQNADIWVKSGFIVYVAYHDEDGPELVPFAPMSALSEYDADNRLVVPGFVDSHTHIESAMTTPGILGRVLAPLGTTTIFADPHEIVNVGGIEAFRYMLESAENSPIRQFFLVPSCVPAVPGYEDAGAHLNADDIDEMFELARRYPNIVGLAEVMDYLGVIKGDERMSGIVSAAAKRHAFIQGHFFAARGRSLAAYGLHRIKSNHENRSGADVAAALRHGFHPDLRLTSSLGSCDIDDLLLGAKCDAFYSECSLCSDDIHIGDILCHGHLNRSVAILIQKGFSAGAAMRIAALNAWREYRVDYAGAIAEGHIADFQILRGDVSSVGLPPAAVFVRGKLVAENGQIADDGPPRESVSAGKFESINTINLNPLSLSDFCIKTPPGSDGAVQANVISVAGAPSRFIQCALPVHDGRIDLDPASDLTYVKVFHRYGGHRVGSGILQGFCLEHGAIASTISHDSHNLIVVYKDPALALQAAQQLQRAGGGICFVSGAGGSHLVPLPVGGLMSANPPETVAKDYADLHDAFAAENGSGANPMRIATLALLVSPNARISEYGYFDVTSKSTVPLFC